MKGRIVRAKEKSIMSSECIDNVMMILPTDMPGTEVQLRLPDMRRNFFHAEFQSVDLERPLMQYAEP
jgi:hypothetical protein